VSSHHTPQVRAATVEDVPIILRLIKGLAEYEELGQHVTASESGLRQSLFGDKPAAEVALAFAGDEPVGFAVWFENYSTFLGRRGIYLEDIFVEPAWRRRGIGRLLLAYVAKIAVDRQCGRLDWAVLDWNEPARRFYRSLGAEPLDGWTIFRLSGRNLEEIAAGKK
jgi:GNAT superfamily N-acetyltransferase